MFCILTVVFLAVMSPALYGKDFGVHGHTFAVEEEDFLEYLERRAGSLSEEEVTVFQERVRDGYVGMFCEPSPIFGLGEAKEYRVFHYDPTVYASEEIKDHQGKIIVEKGTRVNPLELVGVALREDLLIFDGSREDHIAWARSCEGKWILVKGRPLELEEKERVPVYFDQFGAITNKLRVRCVPARVSQEGDRLRIEEIPLKEARCG